MTQQHVTRSDYDVNKRNYEALLSRHESATISEQAGMAGDDVKFRVVDPPRVPLLPSAPNRLMLMSMVFFGGIGEIATRQALESAGLVVEEWQVVLKKIHDDPHELDEFVLRLSIKQGVDREFSEKHVRQSIVDATEVAPNRIEYHTTKEMLEMLGMETELKEKRFLDLRPK